MAGRSEEYVKNFATGLPDIIEPTRFATRPVSGFKARAGGFEEIDSCFIPLYNHERLQVLAQSTHSLKPHTLSQTVYHTSPEPIPFAATHLTTDPSSSMEKKSQYSTTLTLFLTSSGSSSLAISPICSTSPQKNMALSCAYPK